MRQIGSIYHNLTLLRHCGCGAFGDVYYCEDISGKHVAVKIVSKQRIGAAWERELRGVSQYRTITDNAPGLLKIFHVGEDDESFYYTMEVADPLFEDGEYIPDSLAERLRLEPVHEDDLLCLVREVLEGIKSIHRAGFAHRDIKPENILFVKGRPKLADIGLLSSLAADRSSLAGTLCFMPPELQIDNLSGASCQKSDLYAFGKIIYCAATGKGAEQFPSLPREIPMSLPLKYFLSLSFKLCEREAAERIDDIAQLESEINAIEQTLMADGATQEYSYPEQKLTMDIPKAWSVLSPEIIQELLSGCRKNAMYNEAFLNDVLSASKDGMQMIVCRFSQNHMDNVTISPLSEQERAFFEGASDETLSLWLSGTLQGRYALGAEVYAIKRLSLAEYPCTFIDLTHDKNRNRINNYIFQLPDRSIAIALTASPESFPGLRGQFESALATLKFEE